MLEIRPICENCKKPLPPESEEARICSFECTFCADCVENLLQNICPNCCGGFVPRPIRPKDELEKFPASERGVYRPVEPKKQAELIAKFGDIPPQKR